MEDEDRYTRITLRIPKDLHTQLSDEADRTSKSLNAEIVDRLSRTFQGDDTAKLMRSNTVLLRALADFVLLRHKHPEVMVTMEEPILSMAQAVKETKDDTLIMKSAEPGYLGYIDALVQVLEQVTEQLGPGWAKKIPEGLGTPSTGIDRSEGFPAGLGSPSESPPGGVPAGLGSPSESSQPKRKTSSIRGIKPKRG
ncbi:hypothetical protein [Variovorax paradoxus]|uniref:hypothetical protein n=1 Tax=Variovorax paradoxus TaxID=34073 RepID=UPI002481363F|nr:hypothetical protein [Variovorax paradoxus]WGT64772.1 hypothetical protein QHG62_05375 [Variovorax paradoxus]